MMDGDWTHPINPPHLTMVVDDITVDINVGRHGLYYGTSRQVPGLLVAEARIEHMGRAVREAVAALKAAAA